MRVAGPTPVTPTCQRAPEMSQRPDPPTPPRTRAGASARNRKFEQALEAVPSPSGAPGPMSRTELADAVNAELARRGIKACLTDKDIGRYIRGETRWPREHYREALRTVLGVDNDKALGFYPNRRTWSSPHNRRDHSDAVDTSQGSGRSLDEPRNGQEGEYPTVSIDLLALRRALDAYDMPPDGPVRTVDELRAAAADVVRMRLHSRYHDLSNVLPDLLPELGRALELYHGQRRAIAAGLLVQAYRAADAIADKFGLFDLSARIINLLTWAAGQCHDEPTVATAAYVRAETFFANGHYGTGRRMLVRASDQLVPGLSPHAAAAYGALHMRAAVLAARSGRNDLARDHIGEATDIAGHLTEGVYLGTVFGQASVRIHQLSLAVESGDMDAALRTAERWAPPSNVPAERRSHFYIDLARAQGRAGTPAQSLASLYRARQIAPEHVRISPEVRALLGSLAPTGGREQKQLAELAAWAGLSA